jgi:DNA-binding CsgD family transcriptional regulator
VGEVPTVEKRCTDAFAVLDAIGSTSALVFGHCEGGPIAVRMAVQRPDRVCGLILYGTGGRSAPAEVIARFRATVDDWGNGGTLDMFAPSLAGDPIARQARGRFERAAASPALARAAFEAVGDSDVQDLLPKVQVTTLVVHRRAEMVPIDEARLLAEQIDDARLVELDGCDHLPWVGDTAPLLDEVVGFISGFGDGDRAGRPFMRRAAAARPTAGIRGLTARESAVAHLVGEGLSNAEIARQLFVSRHTVESHLKHAFAKLGIDSRVKLAELDRAAHEDP